MKGKQWNCRGQDKGGLDTGHFQGLAPASAPLGGVLVAGKVVEVEVLNFLLNFFEPETSLWNNLPNSCKDVQ
jgi:hypothetical protein